jgi:hypothetical protein
MAQPTVTLRFDELPFQMVDGLSYAGATFHFRVGGIDSDDAFYASYGPGDLTFVSDPSLTGNAAGILTLEFDVPTPVLEFGAALSTAESLTPGLTVQLFSPTGSSRTFELNTVASGPIEFSEGRFSYAGDAISRARIDFADKASDFAIDNLVFQVPEPGTLSLPVIAGLLVVCVRRGCRVVHHR